MKYYVYHLIDPTTNEPFYVGKGSGDRISIHRYSVEKNLELENRHLQRKISKLLKLGLRPIEFKVFEIDDEQAAYDMEVEEIARIGLDNLCNILPGGDKPPRGGHLGKKFSDEHRRKLSEAAKNRPPVSDETRNKLSERHKGNKYNLGRVESKEHRIKRGEKISEANRRPEVKKRRSEAAKNRPPISDRTRKKLSSAQKKRGATTVAIEASRKVNTGRKQTKEEIQKRKESLSQVMKTEEYKRNLSEAIKRKWQDPEYRNKMALSRSVNA